jgi:hypothetical protein
MPGLTRFCALALLPLAFSIEVHGQAASAGAAAGDPASQLPPALARMLNTQVVWDNGFNRPSGPRLRFQKVDEVTRPQGHFTRYRIYAQGVQEGVPYILAAWTIDTGVDGLHVLSDAVYVNRKGLLLTRKPNPEEEDRDTVAEDAEYDLGVQAANGEPMRLVLKNADNTLLVPGTLVPFPVESKDKNCKLSAMLAEPEGEAILISGEGFPPNSEVIVQGSSAGEPKQSRKAVDAGGHIQFVELPYVQGKDTGMLNETISTKDCTVSVTIPWGNGTFQRH